MLLNNFPSNGMKACNPLTNILLICIVLVADVCKGLINNYYPLCPTDSSPGSYDSKRMLAFPISHNMHERPGKLIVIEKRISVGPD